MLQLVPDYSLCSQDLRQAGRKMQPMEAQCQELVQLERKLEVGLSFDQVSKLLAWKVGKLTVLMSHQEMLPRQDHEAQV